jgi:hypothetical protein
VELHRQDLAMLGSACRDMRAVARLAVHAVMTAGCVDVQIERNGWDFLFVLRVVTGERVLEERELRVAWTDIDEPTRLALLLLYVRGALLGAERWQRRSDRAVERALREARARLGLPEGG